MCICFQLVSQACMSLYSVNRISSHRICSRKLPAASKICGDVCSGHASSCAARPGQQHPFVVPDCSAECPGKLQSAASTVSQVRQRQQDPAGCSPAQHPYTSWSTSVVCHAAFLVDTVQCCRHISTGCRDESSQHAAMRSII